MYSTISNAKPFPVWAKEKVPHAPRAIPHFSRHNACTNNNTTQVILNQNIFTYTIDPLWRHNMALVSFCLPWLLNFGNIPFLPLINIVGTTRFKGPLITTAKVCHNRVELSYKSNRYVCTYATILCLVASVSKCTKNTYESF